MHLDCECQTGVTVGHPCAINNTCSTEVRFVPYRFGNLCPYFQGVFGTPYTRYPHC